MGERIVFLDFDGVLNHDKTLSRVDDKGEEVAEHGLQGIDPFCVQELDSLLAVTGAQVVVSSTWRKHFDLAQLRKILRRNGLTLHARLIDVTPIHRPQRMSESVKRGSEVHAWLTKAGCKPTDCVILDDDDDMLHLSSRLVRCNPFAGGLTPAAAARAVSLLRGGRHA